MYRQKQPTLLQHKAVANRKAKKLQPPAGMPDDQRAVWKMSVENLPSDWFSTEQIPMLTEYCRHVCRADQLDAALSQLDPLKDQEAFDKLSKLAAGESAKIAMHARAMRLTQQARYKAETAFGHAAASARAADWDEDSLLA